MSRLRSSTEFFSLLCQHCLGILHLLYGRFSHDSQLLHKDCHRVQAQTQDLWAKHPWGGRKGGFRILTGTFGALPLQICGDLFQPEHARRQENSNTCWLFGPERHYSILGRRTVLNVWDSRWWYCDNSMDGGAVVTHSAWLSVRDEPLTELQSTSLAPLNTFEHCLNHNRSQIFNHTRLKVYHYE